jgi:hypothetical protein
MIVERNVFSIKFGKMKDALAVWNEIFTIFKGEKDAPKIRMFTDMTGPAYTLVLEMELRDLIHIGMKNYKWMSNSKVAELYQKFVPLCDSSERTLYKIEYES